MAGKTITLHSKIKTGATIPMRKIDANTPKPVARRTRVDRSSATTTLTGTAGSTKNDLKLTSGAASKAGARAMHSGENAFRKIGTERALGVGTISTLTGI